MVTVTTGWSLVLALVFAAGLADVLALEVSWFYSTTFSFI